MTQDDSFRIATTSDRVGAVRPHTTTRVSVDRRSMEAASFERDADRANAGSASLPRAKFTALQSLENSQNAEGISIFRDPVPHAGERPPMMRQARRGG